MTIKKFQVLVKGIDWGKNIFVILGCPKYFFSKKFKIKVKSAKIAYWEHGEGVHFFGPAFPDQYAIKSQKK